MIRDYNHKFIYTGFSMIFLCEHLIDFNVMD